MKKFALGHTPSLLTAAAAKLREAAGLEILQQAEGGSVGTQVLSVLLPGLERVVLTVKAEDGVASAQLSLIWAQLK